MNSYQRTIDMAYPDEDACLLEREREGENPSSTCKTWIVKNRKSMAILSVVCILFSVFDVRITPKSIRWNAVGSLFTTASSKPIIKVCVRERDEYRNLVPSKYAFVDCFDDDGANRDDHMGNQFTRADGCARVEYNDIKWDNLPKVVTDNWRADIYCIVTKSGHFNQTYTAQKNNWDPSKTAEIFLDERR